MFTSEFDLMDAPGQELALHSEPSAQRLLASPPQVKTKSIRNIDARQKINSRTPNQLVVADGTRPRA